MTSRLEQWTRARRSPDGLTENTQPNLEGCHLGPYELASRIGSGGMGEVYKARDTRLDRTVAIKVIRPQTSDNWQTRERFQREARAVAALSHPNICTLYDVGSQDGVDYLVMEYLEGATLAGPLPIEDAVKVAVQLASALASAHSHGILHRDLKPGNVMMTAAGAKLLDFGLAKSMELDSDVTRTADGAVVGTVAYMSPEQADGRSVDARSDVFSLGAVLYEMLSGNWAFSGNTTGQVLSAVLRDEPPALRTASAVDAIVRKCLEKHPDQRFHSMDAVRAALEQAAVGSLKALPSIAVLPFASMSPDPDNVYFSDGISEEIINALTHIEGLHVAARTSSFSFKGQSIPVGEIAKRLNVRHVLEGSVRKAGDRVRITAQLVDASNGYQLWSERYDRQLADIFDVQDEIARAIVERLKVALAVGGASRLVKVTTNNMTAYQEYLKGRAMLYRRGPWITQALESFQKAVILDPGYAQALAGVADAYTTLSYWGYRRPEETMPTAIEAATRATVLDPASAEAHNALAIVALLWERDFKKAEREFLEALTLNSRYMQARCWYGLFFLQWGVDRREEGLKEIWTAFEADPLSSYVSTMLSYALAGVGRFDESVVHGRAAVQHDPHSFLAQWALGCAYHWNGQHEEAVRIHETLFGQSNHPWAAFSLVPACVRAGRAEQARGVYERLLTRQAVEYVQPFVLAVCASALGDVDAALAHCESAVAGRDLLFALMHQWWPDFEPVRFNPRFAGIIERFNSLGRGHRSPSGS
jgi:serine/threonine-protein kinase